MVDRKRHILSRVHDADAVADEIACKGRDGCAHNAPDVDQDDVQHDVDYSSHQARPEGMGGVLGRRVDAAEELVEAHHENAHDQYRRIQKCSGILRIGVGVDEDIGQNADKDDQSGTGNKHKGLIRIENPSVESAPILGVVFFNGGHVPRLEEDRRDGGDQIGDLGGNAVDAGGSLTHQSRRPGHVPDKQTVGEARHQPEQGRRNQRHGKPQHHPQDLLVHIPQPEEPVQSGHTPQEQARQQVRQDHGDQKSRNAQVEAGNKRDVEEKQSQGGEDAVYGKEPH